MEKEYGKENKNENPENDYCTKSWFDHSPEGDSKSQIMENPMSMWLLTFPQMREFHDLLGQRPSSLFMFLGWRSFGTDTLTILFSLYIWISWR
jgi:hypothetical protein